MKLTEDMTSIDVKMKMLGCAIKNAAYNLCGATSTSGAVDLGRFLLPAELPALDPALTSDAVALMTGDATSEITVLGAT
jgi:hypothetical protein